MKSFITTFIFALFGSSIQAQILQAITYVEQTHISPKIGTAIGYEFAGNIEVGGFLQRATEQLEAENGRPLMAENEFYGAYMAYPIFQERKAALKFNIRTGVSNGENFVITPSLHAKYKPIPAISFGAGVGTRAFRPTYMATLSINLNGQFGKNFLALK